MRPGGEILADPVVVSAARAFAIKSEINQPGKFDFQDAHIAKEYAD